LNDIETAGHTTSYCDERTFLDQSRLDGGDSVSSVEAAVYDVYDRRRCLNCCTVGAHRAPLQLGNPQFSNWVTTGRHRSEFQWKSV